MGLSASGAENITPSVHHTGTPPTVPDHELRRVKPKQFQMFDLYVLKEWPVREVARALGVSATHVYVNKHRVAGMIKAELKRLERKAVSKPRMDTN